MTLILLPLVNLISVFFIFFIIYLLGFILSLAIHEYMHIITIKKITNLKK